MERKLNRMSEMRNIFDTLEECARWFEILKPIGYTGFSMIEMNGKWHCMAHKYK